MADDFTFEDGSAVVPPTLPVLTCSYASLVNQIGLLVFGKLPAAGSDIISDGTATGNEPALILSAIQRGLQSVYLCGHPWSCLEFIATISTLPPCNAGTIGVSAGGIVTLSGGTFPAYSASSGGLLWIAAPPSPAAGSGFWPVAGYNADGTLTLLGYNGPAIPAGTAYNLVFNRYALPTNCDTANESLTMPSDGYGPDRLLPKVDEIQVRQRMQRASTPRRPEMYALSSALYAPTLLPASTKYISFWPVPDRAYTYEFKATLRATMLDSLNQYPPGDETLAGCLVEACLAAAERDVQGMDAGHPDAVHSRAFPPLLAAAIRIDKERAAPDTLGVDNGGGRGGGERGFRGAAIHLGIGGLDQWI